MKNLIQFMKENKIKAHKLAKKLNVSQATVYTWTSGRSIPGLEAAIKLDRFTRGKVSLYDWV
jgi:DNA-binding XRE family transcriptional regulator